MFKKLSKLPDVDSLIHQQSSDQKEIWNNVCEEKKNETPMIRHQGDFNSFNNPATESNLRS